jgi:subtilisin family serine protease
MHHPVHTFPAASADRGPLGRLLRGVLAAAAVYGLAASAHGQVRTGKLASSGIARTPAVAAAPAAGHASTHLLVQVAPGVTIGKGFFGEPALRQQGRGRTASESARVLREANVVRLTSIWVDPPRDAATARALGLDRWYRAELAPGADPLVARTRLGKLAGSLAHIGLDHEGGLAEIPNDPNFGLQYALRNTGQNVGGSVGIPGADIGATTAWNSTHGSDLVIAVLDSGIDPHPELAGRILPGINVPDGTTITLDECNHGTHVAGILAASGNNGVGMAGLAWNARLMPVVVVNGCTGFEANVASGLVWAVDNGARLVNMSLQFYAFNPIFQQAVQYAHAQGALMVAATGNNGNTNVAAPARWNETIAVAATDNRDVRASFSNFGPEVDISAPGVNVWSLSTGSGYAYKSGTSMAAPHVTAAAALLWSYNPALTRDQVRALLLDGATDLGDPGADGLYGAGRLQIAASIALTPPPFVPEDLNQDGAVNAQDIAIMLGAWGACADCDACVADIDGDCTVGATDVARLLSAF